MTDEIRRRSDDLDLLSCAVEHNHARVSSAVPSLIGQNPIGGTGKYSSPGELVVLDLASDRKRLTSGFQLLLVKGLSHEHPVADIESISRRVGDIGTGMK